jgi:hypothetical protein
MVDLSFFILLPNLASWSALAPRPSMLLQRREVIVPGRPSRARAAKQCDSWSIDEKGGASPGRTAYSAATGSTQPLKMSAQAGSRKRTRADFEREGAPAEVPYFYR